MLAFFQSNVAVFRLFLQKQAENSKQSVNKFPLR